MKYRFSLVVIFCFFINSVFSQVNITQSVFPKKRFVGDTVEVRVYFNSGVDLFSDLEKNVKQRNINLSTVDFNIDNDEFWIKEAVLYKAENSYYLCIYVVPWKTDKIKIPDINLTACLFGKNATSLYIPIESFAVSSILTKENDSELKPASNPLLVPGTIYVVYFVIILIILLLIILVRVLLNWSKIYAKIKTSKLKRMYIKNAKYTLRQLKKLEKQYGKILDKEFCTKLVNIVRDYLNVKYDENFYVISTSKLMEFFNNFFMNLLSEEKTESLSQLVSIFYRLDYIRFASGSIDSKRFPKEEYEAKLKQDEHKQLINQIIQIVKSLEKESENA